MRSEAIFLFALFFVAACAHGSETPPSSFIPDKQIDALLESAIAKRSITGAGVAISKGDTVVFSHGYGATRAVAGEPVTVETRFRVGSISKFFTALGLMRLADEGRLDLRSPIADLLPDVPEAALLPPEVTIERVLNHTAGLDDVPPEDLMARIARGESIDDAAQYSAVARPLLHASGAGWRYSNVGYRLLSRILERASGRDFDTYMRDELGAALGVRGLRLCDAPDGRQTERYIANEGALEPDPSYGVKGLLGEGGLCASAADLVVVPSQLKAGRWINHDLLDMMVRPTTLSNGVIVDYGLGVRRGVIGDQQSWGHSGSGLAGGWAALSHYPGADLTVAVVANGGGAEDAVTLQAKIAAALFGGAPLRDEPLDVATRDAVSGVYASGEDLACYESNDGGIQRRLYNSTRPPRPLVYQGNGVFGREDYPLDRLTFQVAGERAISNRVYYDGFFAELWSPVDQECR